MEKENIVKKILNIVLDVIVGLFVATAVFMIVITVSSKKDSDGTATVFGTQLRFVLSDSMDECDQTDVSGYEIKSIPVKSCVFVETVPEDPTEKQEWYANIKIGDVLTFKYYYGSSQETITHRVVQIDAKDTGGYIYYLEGDNKASDSGVLQQVIDTSQDEKTSFNYVIGKVTGQSYALGLIVYTLKQPVGIVCIIIVPCAIIILFNLARIFRIFSIEKSDKLAEEKARSAAEIEALKEKIAALSNTQNDQTTKEEGK